MGRLLLWILGTSFVLWWVALRRPRRGGSRPARPPMRGATVGSGKMVRDRVCNTFLLETRALRTHIAGDDYFFCSPTCREQFLARLDPSDPERSTRAQDHG